MTILPGGSVQGDITAVGWINNTGTVAGTMTERVTAVYIPPIVYSGYCPGYDYNGEDHDAAELGGTVLAGDPPLGLPRNPNNVFYSEQNEFILSLGGEAWLNFPGTMVAKFDLTIQGKVEITADVGMPSMIVNDDLILADKCELVSEGLLKIHGDIKGSHADAPSPTAKWTHSGPVIVESGGSFSANLQAKIKITYKRERASYQPVGTMVLPLPMLSYTENP